MKRALPPLHPGVMLREEVVKASNLTVTDFAKRLGVSRNALSMILNEKAGISVEMALRLSKALRSSPEFWLNLQRNYDVWQVNQKVDFSQIQPLVFSEDAPKSAYPAS